MTPGSLESSANPDVDPPASPVSRRGAGVWLFPLLVAVISAAGLHLVVRTMRIVSPEVLREGYRVQDWTSNWLMQSMGLEEMMAYGPRSLWQDHIYPPLLDSIRYVLTFPETSAGLPFSAVAVDFRLYVLYAVCFGIVNALLFIWVRSLTRSTWWALGATVVWALMPGYIMTMTLLDPSPLAMLFITMSLFFLYFFLKTRSAGYSSAFFAALLLASLSRSVTQPHVLIIVFIAVVVFWRLSKGRNPVFLIVNIVLAGLMLVMPLKQYVMYATFDTTSFAGYHRAGMLWIDPRTVPEPAYPQHMVDNALLFSTRYNTQETIKDNYRLSAAANDFIITHPLEAAQRLGRSLTVTVPELMRPSSMYTQNYLVERIPWRAPMDWLFSSWRYLLLIIGSATIVYLSRGSSGTKQLLRRYGWFAVFYVLIAAPILFSNRYFPGQEDNGPIWTDAIRQKVFLEVPVFVMLAYALWLVASKQGRALGRWRR